MSKKKVTNKVTDNRYGMGGYIGNSTTGGGGGGNRDLGIAGVPGGVEARGTVARSPLSTNQQEALKSILGRANMAIRVGGTLSGLPLGLLGGLFKGNAQKNIEDYARATADKRSAMERENPAMIDWARRLGIGSAADYSRYTDWAQKSGLRNPADASKGGIADLGGVGKGKISAAAQGASQPSVAGQRPAIYYRWDLGVGIPLPTDPNYTEYQKYLAEKASAQAKLGFT